jgi:hypothetical protein
MSLKSDSSPYSQRAGCPYTRSVRIGIAKQYAIMQIEQANRSGGPRAAARHPIDVPDKAVTPPPRGAIAGGR